MDAIRMQRLKMMKPLDDVSVEVKKIKREENRTCRDQHVFTSAVPAFAVVRGTEKSYHFKNYKMHAMMPDLCCNVQFPDQISAISYRITE